MTAVASAALASLALFEECDARALDALAATLIPRELRQGDLLISEGDTGSSYVIVLDGTATVRRSRVREPLASAGPGSILGELSMLTGHPRNASITASTDLRVAVGDAASFTILLDTPGVHDRLMDIAAQRLAEVAAPVRATLSDGTPIVFRPLLPRDRDAFAAAMANQSPESLRRRFFTALTPNPRVIDYLVNIDYVDHFAWTVATLDPVRGVAIGRYVRLRDDPATGDVAFDVADDHQGRGIGSMLLGALAATAPSAGITRFVGDVLYENAPMRAVFAKADAKPEHSEPGVLRFSVDVGAAAKLIDGDLAAALARCARDVVTGAGLALTARPTISRSDPSSCSER
jgi:CRP-like cAMP-binding protein